MPYMTRAGSRSSPRLATQCDAAAKARGVNLGNLHGPKPFTAEARRQGAEALPCA